MRWWPNDGLMVGQRRRQWATIKPSLKPTPSATWYVDPLMVWWWADVTSGGPTLTYAWSMSWYFSWINYFILVFTSDSQQNCVDHPLYPIYLYSIIFFSIIFYVIVHSALFVLFSSALFYSIPLHFFCYIVLITFFFIFLFSFTIFYLFLFCFVLFYFNKGYFC